MTTSTGEVDFSMLIKNLPAAMAFTNCLGIPDGITNAAEQRGEGMRYKRALAVASWAIRK